MKICYQIKNGIEYAKTEGSSYRVGDKVLKKDVIYLGRVIDKKNNIFCNRERGTFSYDPDTGLFGKADEQYSSDLKSDGRKKIKSVLDFGDSFFIDQLIKDIHYDEVINQLSYRNKDTLKAMIQFYILSEATNSHAGTWYEGSFASLLYPDANLTSQRISDFLESIGNMNEVNSFFDAHIAWVKKYVCNDNAIIVDSTGLPNQISTPMTAISNHNGKVSNEIRMTVSLQRDSGYPLMFRLTPGNIVDMSTIERTVDALNQRNMDTDFSLLDAGYVTKENINQLFSAGIDFVARMPEKFTEYKNLVKHSSDLEQEENLVEYKNRYVYIKQYEIEFGDQGHKVYAYLGKDIERSGDEAHKMLKRQMKKKTDKATLHKELQNSGLFAIMSSLPFKPDEILEVYYIRQEVEQYFDLSKGSSKMIPLRVQSEESIYGHLILSMIASTINHYIDSKTERVSYNREEILMSLRNQKCLLYKNTVNTMEPQSKANEYYREFNIKCPLHFIKNTTGKLTPIYHLEKHTQDMQL